MCQGKTRKRKKNSLFTSIERNYQNIYGLMLQRREKLERLEIDIVLLWPPENSVKNLNPNDSNIYFRRNCIFFHLKPKPFKTVQ